MHCYDLRALVRTVLELGNPDALHPILPRNASVQQRRRHAVLMVGFWTSAARD